VMAWRVFEFRAASGASVKKPDFPKMPEIGEIWHNAFSDLLKENAGPVERLLAQSSEVLGLSRDPGLVGIALAHHELAFSIGEAIQVSNRVGADQLGIPLNQQFDGKLILVRSPASPEARIGKMDIFVLGPFAQDVDTLREEWNAWLRANKATIGRLRKKAADDAKSIGNAAANLAEILALATKELGNHAKVTAPNLASVMLMVEEGGKRILLTGDGHWADILAGLEHHAAFDAAGRLHVDVLKFQHHGSEHNASEEFCERVTADNYVFCGNGKHENPDLDVLDLLCTTHPKVRPDRPFTLWFNCAAAVAPAGAPRQHMTKVEKKVGGFVNGSGGNIRAKFLEASSFDLVL